MLQQTQVGTVIPYYNKFLARFPTISDLAGANLNEVLQLWSGLGYYRRARQMHEAARKIITSHRGSIPESPEDLIKLPGIGKYTAGAIASIAFGKRAPILDGNVIRILTRIFGLGYDVSLSKTISLLWKISDILTPHNAPGDFNQAMMELGALICLPKNPACTQCPVAARCQSRLNGHPERYPIKSRREKLSSKKTTAAVVKKGNRVLIQKQPLSAPWGGLWIYPMAKNKADLANLLGVPRSALRQSFDIQHGYTRYKVTMRVYKADTPYAPKLSQQHLWVPLAKIKQYAFPAPHKKITDSLLTAHG